VGDDFQAPKHDFELLAESDPNIGLSWLLYRKQVKIQTLKDNAECGASMEIGLRSPRLCVRTSGQTGKSSELWIMWNTHGHRGSSLRFTSVNECPELQNNATF